MVRWLRHEMRLRLPVQGPQEWRRGVLLVSLLGILLAGCSDSSGPSYGSPDGRKIAELVDAVSDLSNPRALASHFVRGAAPSRPADLRRFTSYRYDVVGDPAVSSDTATAQVLVRKQSDSADVGQVEWSFVKEGDTWRIKAAPLP